MGYTTHGNGDSQTQGRVPRQGNRVTHTLRTTLNTNTTYNTHNPPAHLTGTGPREAMCTRHAYGPCR